MRRLPFLLATCAAASVLAAQAPVVDSIAIETVDIFGAAEARANVLFGIANALHVTTRTGVIRRELLFAAGAPYDSAAVAETARNLRRLGIFRDVTIDTLRVDGRLVTRVRTADGWSTSVELGARSTGDQFTWSVGLFESNLLGTGTRAGVAYRQETDRTAWRASGRIRRLGASRVALEGFYDALSDGHEGAAVVGVPFRAYQDPAAVTVEGHAADRRVLQYRDGVLLDSWRRRQELLRLTMARAVRRSNTGYLRVGLAAQLRQEALVLRPDSATPAPTTPDSVTAAAGFVADWLRARYRVVRHFNGFGREEDLDLSTGVSLGVWVAPGGLGYARTGVGPSLGLRTAVPLGAHFLKFQVDAGALFTGDGVDSAFVLGSATLGLRPLARHSIAVFVQAGAQHDPRPGREFDLGHARGPRAFQAHSFTGTRMAWSTVEHRWFLADDLLHLFGAGLAAFADFGGAWYPDQAPRTGGDVGLGLRLGPSRASGLNVGRFDVAWRFGDGVGDDRWVFSFGRAFVF
jgi:hypothetical protein